MDVGCGGSGDYYIAVCLVFICLLYEFHSFFHIHIPLTRDPVKRIGEAVQMVNGQAPPSPT